MTTPAADDQGGLRGEILYTGLKKKIRLGLTHPNKEII
jgi:hypothetical protein